MLINDWLKKAKQQIAALDAELILLDVLRQKDEDELDRSYIFAHPEREITAEEREKLDRMVARRANGEPLAYIRGYKEFYGRDFRVDERVLIPRPETEDLIILTLKAGQRLVAEEVSNLEILEIGTGSGCIATTLALEFGALGVDTEILATDISQDALEVAQKNAVKLGAKVKFTKSDLLEEVPKTANFGILVANLPYVDPEWTWITRKSLDFEPQEALYAAEKGLALYDRLLGQIGQFGALRYLIFEADPCQHEILSQKVVEKGYVLREVLGFGLLFERK